PITKPSAITDAAAITKPSAITNATTITKPSAITDTATIAQGINLIAIAAVNVCIPVEIVIDVHVDVAATPTATPPPTDAPEGAHRKPNPEGHRRRGIRPSVIRRIVDIWIRIYRRTVDVNGIVRRHIDDFRIRLFDHDHLLAFDHLRLHRLLLV